MTVGFEVSLMRVIIISGVSRSGKTTLAKKLLQKLPVALVDGDAIVNGFLVGIKDKKLLKCNSKQGFWNYLELFFVEHIRASQHSVVLLETELLTPRNYINFARYFDQKDYNIIYTHSANNYPRLTPQKCFEVKKFTYLIKSI